MEETKKILQNIQNNLSSAINDYEHSYVTIEEFVERVKFINEDLSEMIINIDIK